MRVTTFRRRCAHARPTEGYLWAVETHGPKNNVIPFPKIGRQITPLRNTTPYFFTSDDGIRTNISLLTNPSTEKNERRGQRCSRDRDIRECQTL